ncbi:MAG: autoinducer binding domain-containing protein [Pseudomonadales bacterium]|nr:autoinducer binding domain-containing protein [Pseudomonadales bacterium]
MSLDLSGALFSLSQNLPLSCEFSGVAKAGSYCLGNIENSLYAFANNLGYPYLRYSYWLKNTEAANVDEHAYSVNFSNIPPEWDSHYERNKMYLVDPVVRVLHENAGVEKLQWGYWADAYQYGLDKPLGETDREKSAYTEKVKQLIRGAEQHKMCSGLYFCWGDGIRQIILSMASPVKDYRPELGEEVLIEKLLYSVAMLINQSIMTTNTQSCVNCNKALRVSGGKTIKLTVTEIKILNIFYAKKNMTIKQVANVCGISVNTVNFHLRSMREKFETPGASGHALASFAKELNLV